MVFAIFVIDSQIHPVNAIKKNNTHESQLRKARKINYITLKNDNFKKWR